MHFCGPQGLPAFPGQSILSVRGTTVEKWGPVGEGSREGRRSTSCHAEVRPCRAQAPPDQAGAPLLLGPKHKSARGHVPSPVASRRAPCALSHPSLGNPAGSRPQCQQLSSGLKRSLGPFPARVHPGWSPSGTHSSSPTGRSCTCRKGQCFCLAWPLLSPLRSPQQTIHAGLLSRPRPRQVHVHISGQGHHGEEERLLEKKGHSEVEPAEEAGILAVSLREAEEGPRRPPGAPLLPTREVRLRGSPRWLMLSSSFSLLHSLVTL